MLLTAKAVEDIQDADVIEPSDPFDITEGEYDDPQCVNACMEDDCIIPMPA